MEIVGYEVCEAGSPLAFRQWVVHNTHMLPGGKYAVYHFKGYTREIYAAYQGIHNVWFPQSGFQIDKRYNFEIYRSVNCDTMYMEIDFCIPIKWYQNQKYQIELTVQNQPRKCFIFSVWRIRQIDLYKNMLVKASFQRLFLTNLLDSEQIQIEQEFRSIYKNISL